MILNEQFIKLGSGYGDVYELFELMKTNEHRLHQTYLLIAEHEGKTICSLAASFQPASENYFLPIYICQEGIPYDEEQPSQRVTLFQQCATSLGKTPIPVTVRHSTTFSEDDLFYQYIIGILRLNNLLPNLR